MNVVTLVGRLTKDVELKYTPSGVAVASFTVAVNRRFKNQNGEREADFINCQIWRTPAENTANFVKKGSRVGVTGEWRTRNFEGQDGKKVYVNELLVENIEFLDAFEANEQRNNQGNTNTTQRQQNANTGQNNGFNQPLNQNNNDPFANNGQPIDISDDDFPF